MSGRGGRIHSASPGGVKRVDFGEGALQRAAVACPCHDRLHVAQREQAAERDLRELATQLRKALAGHDRHGDGWADRDRKSTRLNSSHGYISYAVFCLKKKK